MEQAGAAGRGRILRFGIVGCGRVSGHHLRALSSGAMAAEVVAVADVREDRARRASEAYRVPWYGDYHAMLRAQPEIDVISVLTPSGDHARHVVDLARHGRPIVVEKPMALRVADCDAMLRACRARGCRLFVVHQNRYNPAVVAARRALEAGRLGAMVLGTARVRWRRDQAYYDQDAWRGTWALDGGVIAQQASHHVDLLRWFMGPVRRLQCQIATRLARIEAEDTAVALLTFESGALGVLEATTAARPADLEASLSLLGEHGTIVLGGPAVNRVEHWRFDVETEADGRVRREASEEVPDVYGHGHAGYLAGVVEALLAGRPGPVEGEEARETVRLVTAMYESAARGGAPLPPGARVVRARIGRG